MEREEILEAEEKEDWEVRGVDSESAQTPHKVGSLYEYKFLV